MSNHLKTACVRGSPAVGGGLGVRQKLQKAEELEDKSCLCLRKVWYLYPEVCRWHS